MADLSEIQSSQSIKIAGAGPSTGIETNWAGVDANGNLQVVPTTAGPVTPGTAAGNANLIAGQFNTVLPTLTTGQQSAIQLDSSGRLLIDTPQDRSGSGSISVLDGVVTANTQGMSTVNFNITGTWVGTMRAEGTLDGGATWLLLVSVGTAQSVFATSTVNDIFKVACGGYSQVRMRMSAYTSGTATVEWDAGIGPTVFQVWNTNATSLKTAPRSDVLNLTGSAGSLNADAVAAIDVGGYSAVEIQITGTWVGTLTFQGSNDNSNFVSVVGTDISSSTSIPITTVSTNGIFFIPLLCRYFRCRMTAYTSGTATSTHTFETITSSDLQAKNITIRNSSGLLTNRSGITSGTINTSTQIMAANSARQYLFIQNVGTNVIWINFTSVATTTQPSIMLTAGASFVQEGSFVSTEAINVISGSASVPYTAKEA